MTITITSLMNTPSAPQTKADADRALALHAAASSADLLSDGEILDLLATSSEAASMVEVFALARLERALRQRHGFVLDLDRR